MKKDYLRVLFNNAKQNGARYVGVAIETRGMSKPEYIINPRENITEKLAYYEKAYNDDLVLNTYDGIRIAAVAQGNTAADVMAFLGDKDE